MSIQLAKYVKQNVYGEKIVIGMGAGSISSWIRNLPKFNIMLVDSLKKFSKQTNGKLIFDYDLKKTNWFNIGGNAKAFFKPENLKDLARLFKKFLEIKKKFSH